MQLCALQGSYLEGQVLEEQFQVDAISTARLLGIAAGARQDGVKAEIRPAGNAIGLIEAGEETESGWITVRAASAANPCVYKEARVFVGCPTCENGVCEDLAGIGIGLGPGKGGRTAGHLFVYAHELETGGRTKLDAQLARV